MIEIKVKENGFVLKGHAKYAKTGGDIVCASISTIFQSLILGIEKLTKDKIHYQLKPGDSWVVIEEFSKESIVLYNNFFLSAVAIAEEYPENVQVILGD